MRLAWVGILLTGCAGAAASTSPAGPEPAREPAVTIVAWAVPSALQVGQAGYLQVKLVSTQTIERGVLSATSPDPSLTVVPREIAVNDLHPIVHDPNVRRHSPPPLGAFPIFTFQMRAAKPGVFPIEVKFVYGSTAVTQQITITGEIK